MAEDIINRVSKSGIESIDLGDYYPEGPVVSLDVKDWLFHGLILREKDFREKLEQYPWEEYAGKHVAVHCTTDAIIPAWAYMLLASRLQPVAASVYFGTETELVMQYYLQALQKLDAAAFADKRVVVKGCGDKPVPDAAFLDITIKLMPYAKSIMYGEPCSTVPVYKKGKAS